MHLSGLDLFFWTASFLGHLVLLFVLWERHRAEQFPFFTALISTESRSIDSAVPGHALWDQGRLLLHLLVGCSTR